MRIRITTMYKKLTYIALILIAFLSLSANATNPPPDKYGCYYDSKGNYICP